MPFLRGIRHGLIFSREAVDAKIFRSAQSEFQSRNRVSYLFKRPRAYWRSSCILRFNLVIECLIFSRPCANEKHKDRLLSFNLGIECLIFSSADAVFAWYQAWEFQSRNRVSYLFKRPRAYWRSSCILRFNLVIECLIFSRLIRNPMWRVRVELFQSRNRVSYLFKTMCERET
jgi:hypothetical protein